MTPRAEMEAALDNVRLHIDNSRHYTTEEMEADLDLILQLGAARERERVVAILTKMYLIHGVVDVINGEDE